MAALENITNRTVDSRTVFIAVAYSKKDHKQNEMCLDLNKPISHLESPSQPPIVSGWPRGSRSLWPGPKPLQARPGASQLLPPGTAGPAKEPFVSIQTYVGVEKLFKTLKRNNWGLLLFQETNYQPKPAVPWALAVPAEVRCRWKCSELLSPSRPNGLKPVTPPYRFLFFSFSLTLLTQTRFTKRIIN